MSSVLYVRQSQYCTEDDKYLMTEPLTYSTYCNCWCLTCKIPPRPCTTWDCRGSVAGSSTWPHTDTLQQSTVGALLPQYIDKIKDEVGHMHELSYLLKYCNVLLPAEEGGIVTPLLVVGNYYCIQADTALATWTWQQLQFWIDFFNNEINRGCWSGNTEK